VRPVIETNNQAFLLKYVMNLLTAKIQSAYFQYLTAAFSSAMIASIYGVVDTAMVGQYYGPRGAAAMAVTAPVWNIIYSLGLLMGIGGSVLFSSLRGESEDNQKRSNEYFTAAVIGTAALAMITWILILFFDRELLLLFGAEEHLLKIAREYVFPVKFAVPSFLFTMLISAFLRNDGNPGLAAKAVLFGGIFNVFGDYVFIFVCDLGATGAGMATAMGSVLSLMIMLCHFGSKKNSLCLVKTEKIFSKLAMIIITGFSTFFVDAAMGILTILFNRQILVYLGTDALSVYGVIINISTFVQCCSYSIGQASQPIISVNFGAARRDRIRQLLKYALGTAAFFGIFWTVLSFAVPNLYVYIFMKPAENILQFAPSIIRIYGLSFLLLPLNIFATYYFQAILEPTTSFIVSVSRGAVISGILVYLLPAAAGANSIWFVMPITEFVVAIYIVIMMIRSTSKHPVCT
jgi:Na+-driven multidrug efflux pump